MHMTHWDLSGMTEPIKVDKKVAMQALKSLGWDDPIPEEDIEAWKERFRQYIALQNLSWDRCIIPIDAVEPLHMKIICCNDGAEEMAGSAVYGCVKRNNGRFSSEIAYFTSLASLAQGDILGGKRQFQMRYMTFFQLKRLKSH